MSVDHREIYARHAGRYHELVSAEDAHQELAGALARLVPLSGAEALDVGAGTGRVSRILLDAGARVTAVDAAPAMLDVARAELSERPIRIVHGDARELPLPDQSFDLAVAGWVFGHFSYWNEPGWREDVRRALAEMRRVTREGGTLVVIETLGTGAAEPAPPDPRLAAYYAWLEAEQGFERSVISTDYEFSSAERALELAGFFFGPELAKKIERSGSHRLSEWTGVWHARAHRGKV